MVTFLWIPILIMALYAFNSSTIQSWPIPGFTTHWIERRDYNCIGAFIDDQVHACGLLKGSDVAAFATYDSALDVFSR